MGIRRWILAVITIVICIPKVSFSNKPDAISSPEFIENKGQWPAQVLYKLKVANNDLYFEKGIFTFNLHDPEFFHAHDGEAHNHSNEGLRSHSYKAIFMGANPDVEIKGYSKNQHYTNYILGNDPSKWASNVPSYKELDYRELYEGIDMKVYGNEGNLKYDLIVAPHANPDLIKVKYEGLDKLYLKGGDLHAKTSVGEVVEKRPYAYQVIDGERREVRCEFRLKNGVMSFKILERYDESLSLIIDPTLVFSSYSGSTTDNFGVTATYDNQGNLYSGSTAFGSGYPTTVGAFQTSHGGGNIDMAISKFNSAGNTLIYSTYIGGSGADVPQSLVVNHNNELVILGSTSSTNYPVTGNAYDNSFNGGNTVSYIGFGFTFTGGSDITVTVVSQGGNSLVGATYLGGSGNDGVNRARDTLDYNYGDALRGEVIVNDANEIYIASSTLSDNFPVTSGCYQNTRAGRQDACVAKLSSDVSSLIWSTYLGGTHNDAGYSLKLASNNSLYIVGGTSSTNFPTTNGTLHPTYRGGISDGYLFNLNANGTAMINSTYLGTQVYDQVFFVDLDGNDQVYVYGQTLGTYPISNVNYSIPNTRQFIHALSPSLNTTAFSTTFGDIAGSGLINISPTAFLVDICGRVYISGWGGLTNVSSGEGDNLGFTNNMPITSDAFQSVTDGSDFYFAVFARDIDTLVYATYFGGVGTGINEHVDGGTSRFDKNGIIYQAVCAGCGGSSAFPTTPGAYSNTNNSPNCNIGVIKFAFDIIGVDVSVEPEAGTVVCPPYGVQFTGNHTNAVDFFWDFGDGETSTQQNPYHTYSDTGLYNVMFIGVDSTTCLDTAFADTAYTTIYATQYDIPVDIGPDITTCVNTPVQLSTIVGGNHSGIASYQWSPSTGLSNPNIDNPIANPPDSVTYIITVTDTPGCFGIDTLNFAVVDIDVSNDTAVCEGACVQLQASGASSYTWTPSTGLNDSTISNPIACSDSTTTYTVSSQVMSGNIIVNGDFEQGNVGFTSDLEYNSDLFPTDRYYIDTNATPYRPGWSGFDHTNPPTGNFFISNGPTSAGQNVWCQTVTVSPNTDYMLSAWASIVSPSNPAVLQFSINGQPVGTHNAPNQIGVWNEFTRVWNSGSNTTATICIEDLNIQTAGNDFGLDDISFGALCEVSEQVTITVNTVPVASAEPDTVICLGDTVQLNATGGDTYSWSPVFGLSNPNIANPIAIPFTSTDYEVIVSTLQGCSDTDTVSIVVNPLPQVTASPDTLICLGDTVQLMATGAINYSWTPSTNLSDSSIANPLAYPDTNTLYVLVGTDSLGCTGADSAQVDVFQVIVSQDTAVCIGDTAHLLAIGGVSWSWSPTTGLSDPNIQNPDVYVTATTTFVVTATDANGCISIDSVRVIVQSYPTADAGGDMQICEGSSAQLNATGGVTYVWTPTTGLSNPNINNPVATPNDTTLYVVTVSDSIGCSDSDSITIFVNPPPTADAGPDTAYCIGGSTQLNATGGSIYSWNPTTDLSNPNIANPIANPTATTTYTVTVQSPSGQQFINADFEQGNTGFNTGYNYNPASVNTPGEYTITTDASTVNPNYIGNMDHTSGSGNFMVVNGQFTTNTSVWCQTVTVAPNTDYYIGVWVNTLNNGDPALLQFTADGQPTGAPFLAPPFGLNNWYEYYNVWNSGSNTTVTICLQNLTTTTGPTGFGIDDFVFGPLCQDQDQVTVTVNPLPQVNAGTDQNICLGESAQLNATGASTYNWSPTTFLDNNTIANPTSTPLAAVSTTYTVTGVDTNGCVNSDQVTVTATTPPTATVSPSTFICEGESTTLTAGGGTAFNWTPTAGLSNPSGPTTEASPTTTTTYTVEVTDQAGCSDTTQVTVTVYSLPTAEAGPDINLCYGEIAQLNATGGTSYSWSPTSNLSNPNIANPQTSTTVDITYTVTVTDIHGCQNQDSVRVDVFTITVEPDSTLCKGDSMQLFVSGGSSFMWFPTESLSDPTSSSPIAFPTETTVYTVTATDSFGCQDQAELTLQVLAAPIAGFTMEFLPSCEGIMGYFENTSEDGVSYIWDFGDGETSDAAEPVHLFQVGPGAVVQLITFNGDGCADTISIDSSSVTYSNEGFDIIVPNVFTPNSDGLNDCFIPAFDGAFNDCFEMKVYNRWGALIFESIAQGHCWDGRNKAGRMMEEGTYYYIVDVNGSKWAGFVQLLY